MDSGYLGLWDAYFVVAVVVVVDAAAAAVFGTNVLGGCSVADGGGGDGVQF